jgi:hypothetical protein
LAATNRPTCCSRIGNEGKAMQSSSRGEDFGSGWAMKHMLHKLHFDATFETRSPRPAEDRCRREVLVP